MSKNVNDYMTEEERRQVEAILDKAGERMRNMQPASRERQFIFLECRCEYCQRMAQQNQENREKTDFEDDVQKLLAQICDFCKRHRACFRKDGGAKEREEKEEDDDLPF